MRDVKAWGLTDVTIILPAINETFSFEKTVEIILEECKKEDIREFIAVVCKRTTEESLSSIRRMKDKCEKLGYEFYILWQKRPFAGGAVRDAIDIAKGSHLIMMSTDLETDPHVVAQLIEEERKHPKDITTASRWLSKNNFVGYDKKKEFLNFCFQRIFSLYYGVKLTDMTYAFRIFPTKLMKRIKWEELKHPFYLETALKPVRLGIKFHEIPARWVSRQEGESQNSFLQTFAYVRPALKIRFYSKKMILKKVNGRNEKEVKG